MRYSLTISKYLIGAVLPYFVFAWLLLSVILFVQQASRFSDIFFSANIPTQLVWQLTLALIPSVIAFTCPMAALVGVIIGLSKMQGDSEIIAIRAAGVGNIQIAVPILLLGIILSLLAFTINLYGVPLAASIVRKVALQTAIYKLESPIEPGVFNTELAGYTVYVKDGDIGAGTWKNIFIFSEDEKTATMRLITSQSGRIDTTGQSSELVLENASASTFTRVPGEQKYVSENIGEFRFAIKTRRGELIEKLGSAELTPEELGLARLSDYAQSKQGSERTEAEIVRNRRITLSLTPIFFSLLGTAMVLRYRGRGRGFGIFVALVALVCYFLIAFLGEQLGRTGRISPFTGSLIPIAASLIAIAWFSRRSGVKLRSRHLPLGRVAFWLRRVAARVKPRRNFLVDLTTGLGDFDLLVDLAKYYLLTLGFLTTVFVVFTAFELWKFAGTFEGGTLLLLQYLLWLVPFIYLQLAPSSAMVATLATYVIKSRQNEVVTWISAGQSTYRLLLPCFIFMIVLGFGNWQIEEHIAPSANQKQDRLRTQLRNRGKVLEGAKRYWVARDRRIYSFAAGSESDNEKKGINNISKTAASDNEIAKSQNISPNEKIATLSIYEFGDQGKLQTLYRAESAVWDGDGIILGQNSTKTELQQGMVAASSAAGLEIPETGNLFSGMILKPSQLNMEKTGRRLNESESEIERRIFAVALEKKYTTLVLPFVIALFTAPFSLSPSRKGKVATVGAAIALWLLFIGIMSIFEQLGLGGYIAAPLAVWSPIVLFSTVGVFLLSRIRT